MHFKIFTFTLLVVRLTIAFTLLTPGDKRISMNRAPWSRQKTENSRVTLANRLELKTTLDIFQQPTNRMSPW